MRKVMAGTWRLWQRHRVPRVAAALSFYAIFTMPALLFLVVFLGRSILRRSDTLATIDAQLSPFVGTSGTRGINTLVAASAHNLTSIPLFISIAMLLFAVFAIFMQVQEALDDVWEIAEQQRGGLWEIVALRLHVILVIVALALLAMATLFIAAVAGRSVALPANALAILAFLTIAYRVLPRVKAGWRNSALGALMTAAVLILGEAALSLYFTRLRPGRVYGDAGSIIVLLLWIYYSSLLFLFGATLTRSLEENAKNGIADS
jgi:membrane protein